MGHGYSGSVPESQGPVFSNNGAARLFLIHLYSWHSESQNHLQFHWDRMTHAQLSAPGLASYLLIRRAIPAAHQNQVPMGLRMAHSGNRNQNTSRPPTPRHFPPYHTR